jgi:hypothetical protein
VTTKSDIKGWLEEAKQKGARYMLVVCDTFDYGDYPVSIMPNQKIDDIAPTYHYRNMQKVMECYDLNMDWERQLNEARSWNGWKP